MVLHSTSNRLTSTTPVFKTKLKDGNFNDAQRAGIEIRTGLLDAYLNEDVPDVTTFFGKGDLVIVDLSDPFLAGRYPLLSRLAFN